MLGNDGEASKRTLCPNMCKTEEQNLFPQFITTPFGLHCSNSSRLLCFTGIKPILHLQRLDFFFEESVTSWVGVTCRGNKSQSPVLLASEPHLEVRALASVHFWLPDKEASCNNTLPDQAEIVNSWLPGHTRALAQTHARTHTHFATTGNDVRRGSLVVSQFWNLETSKRCRLTS